MSFSPTVKDKALVACGRHCCICHVFCGKNIEIHHIKLESVGGTNLFENAIPLCFNCHADMTSYDAKHPKGSKYSETELKHHRDNWYKKMQESHGLITKMEDGVATDKNVYEILVRVLPWNGSLFFIRHNFPILPFDLNRLDDLSKFQHECENPSFEFIDPELEGLRVTLHDHIQEFALLVGFKTFPTNTTGWNTVPEEWEDEQPERFKEVINSLQNAARNVCDGYDALVKLAAKKLGIISTISDERPNR